MPLQVYALCRTVQQQRLWQTRTGFFPGLSIEVVYPVRSAVDLVHNWIATATEPFLVCQEDTWFGLNLAAAVAWLLAELTEQYPRWGMCSNRGARWDGSIVDFSPVFDQPGLQTALGPQPVLTAGDSLLLINPAVLRSLPRHLPPFLPGTSCALALSLDCLRNQVPVLADPRLLALRVEEVNRDNQQQVVASPAFRAYYGGAFVNHQIPSAEGLVDLSDGFNFHGAFDPGRAGERADLLSRYDQVLVSNGRQPSLTLCSRTQFRRPELLQRTVASFAAAKIETGDLADIQAVLITDQPEATAAPCLAELHDLYPVAQLQCWYHTMRPPRFSRTDLILAAIERATTDYIWFVDDDDFVIPAGCRAAARDLLPGRARLLVGDSYAVREEWAEPTASRPYRVLENAHREAQYKSRSVLTALSGRNKVPLCSMIVPVKLAQDRLRRVQALGDFNEDYFLLLLLLTAPRVELALLDITLAGISLRGEENTVALTDMDQWHLSYCTFLLEILTNSEGNSPAVWQLANRAAPE